MAARAILLCLLMYAMSLNAQQTHEQLDSVINSLNLKEVVVTASKIRQSGDTISYSAATYRSKKDRSLLDLLAKMPGIEVKADGQVMYNGQWIAEFYIEGMDMLGDNYGVATRNIDAQAIGSVQILQNNQDVKMLRGVRRGNSPAMNITLKETSKGVWSSTVQGAVGFRPQMSWDASATLMNFRRKSQNISVLKSNNIGSDLRKEINAPATFNSSYGTGLLYPNQPSLDNHFAYCNQSGSATINQLFKLSNDKTLTFNLNYLFDKEKRESHDITTYLADSISWHLIEESNRSDMRQHFIGANAVYKNNSREHYIKNKISFSASFHKGNGLINSRILQNATGYSVAVTDVLDLNWHRPGGGIADGKFDFAFTNRKGWLRLSDTDFSQMVDQRCFWANGSASLLAIAIPHFMFNLNAGFNTSCQRAETLHNVSTAAIQARQTTWQAGVHVAPKLFWHYGQRFQLLMYVPVGFNYYDSDGGEWNYDKCFFSIKPYSNITYKYSDKLSFSLTATSEESTPAALSLMVAKRYLDYRTTIGNPSMVETRINRNFSSSLNGRYTDVLNMIFGSASFIYAYTNSGMTSSYNIVNNLIEYIWNPVSTHGNTFQFDQIFSKGFFRWNSKISESLTLGTGKSEYLVGNEIHTSKTNYLRTKIGYNATFARWITFDTSYEFVLSKAFTDGEASSDPKYSCTNATSLIISLIESISFKPSIIYYHNNYSTAYRNNVFLNCNIEYNIGNTALSIQCNNLLDCKTFRIYSDNGIIRHSNEYKLRGRTVLFGIRLRI